MRPAAQLSPVALLERPVADHVAADGSLWGFGGFHGGLTLALLGSAMGAQAPGRELRSIHATYHRAIRDDFRIDVRTVRAGATVTTVAAEASTSHGVGVTAAAVFAPPAPMTVPAVVPRPPAAPVPEALEVFAMPPELAPIAAHTEIRPVGATRPYAGGDVPELTAWVRLVADDEPPDPLRLVFLMDALAPSYAAVLAAPLLIPTIELSVQPGAPLGEATSPWVLLRARTTAADGSGWLDERIDAWGPDGDHLGVAHQLRLVRP